MTINADLLMGVKIGVGIGTILGALLPLFYSWLATRTSKPREFHIPAKDLLKFTVMEGGKEEFKVFHVPSGLTVQHRETAAAMRCLKAGLERGVGSE